MANNPSAFTFKADFDAQSQVEGGTDDLLIYALSYYLDITPGELKDDVTDGGNDQSTDLVHFDLENSRAIIAQGTTSKEWFKQQGSTAKAATLGQAVNWLLVAPEAQIPERIRAKAIELREHIQSSEIDLIELIFVHNALDSKPVKAELSVLADTYSKLHEGLSFKGVELGPNAIEEMFVAATSLMSIHEKVTVPIISHAEFVDDKRWKVILAAVPATAIFDLYDKYEDRLFSANVRDYLGSKKSTKNINNAIKETATKQGKDFFVFNNGITLVTASIALSADEKSLELGGVSVINGAQTTGVIHEAGREAAATVTLQCRFLQSTDQKLIEDAVRYNNTQNAVKASDRKSNDEVQKRLTREFELVGLKYVARRARAQGAGGGVKIEADSIAQAMCSFSGDLTVATRNRAQIWDDQKQYERVFPSSLPWNCVWHVFLVAKALDATVSDIRAKASSADATTSQKSQAHLMSFSPSKQAVLFLYGLLREEIMGKGITEPLSWCAKPSTVEVDRVKLMAAVQTILGRIISRVANANLSPEGFYNLVRTEGELRKMLPDLKSFFEDLFNELDAAAVVRALTYIQ